MNTSLEQSYEHSYGDKLALSCRLLRRFDFENSNWDEIRAAFKNAACCELGQSWRKKLHRRFEPATVRVMWQPEALFVYAEMCDRDIYTTATELNQHTYLFGDAFEIFLHPLSCSDYYELHIAPNNQHLQLRFTRGYQTPQDMNHVEDPEFFQSRVLVEEDKDVWRVLARLPAKNLTGQRIAIGEQWMFSFSRYDYTRETARPVLSSTSLHSRPNFHDRHDWGTLNFAR